MLAELLAEAEADALALAEAEADADGVLLALLLAAALVDDVLLGVALDAVSATACACWVAGKAQAAHPAPNTATEANVEPTIARALTS